MMYNGKLPMFGYELCSIAHVENINNSRRYLLHSNSKLEIGTLFMISYIRISEIVKISTSRNRKFFTTEFVPNWFLRIY